MTEVQTLWWAAGTLLAVFATALAVIMFELFARLTGLVDIPGGRRDHLEPTPLVGGLAIAVGALPVLLALTRADSATVGLVSASLVLLFFGVLDDRFDMPWFYRLLGQALAAILMIQIGGVRIEHMGPILGGSPIQLGPVSKPLTIVVTIGIINAVNFTDGVDGLAATLCLCAIGMGAAAAFYSGDTGLLMETGPLLGAILVFLWFNCRSPWRANARIFLGNAGAEFLGLVVAWVTFRLTQNPLHPVSVVLAPFLLVAPVTDCLTLIVRRLRAGVSPFKADRGHVHHLLLDAGYSVPQVVISMAALSLAVGACAAILLRAHIPHPVFGVIFLMLLSGYYLLTESRQRAVSILGRANPFQRVGNMSNR